MLPNRLIAFVRQNKYAKYSLGETQGLSDFLDEGKKDNLVIWALGYMEHFATPLHTTCPTPSLAMSSEHAL